MQKDEKTSITKAEITAFIETIHQLESKIMRLSEENKLLKRELKLYENLRSNLKFDVVTGKSFRTELNN